MERIVDIAIVLACCVLSLAVFAWCPALAPEALAAYGGVTGPLTVACFLLSVISALGCEWLSSRRRVAMPVAYCLLCAVAPPAVYFLPAVLYELVRFIREPLPWRIAPVAALAPVVAAAGRGDGPAAMTLVALVAALAALLSLRTSSLLAQRDLTHRTRDDLRERELSMHEGGASSWQEPEGASENGEPEARPREFACLTEREYEIVRLVAEGLDNHEIAAAAFISEGTVRNRISSVLSKTGYKNRTQLAVAWWRARMS